MMLTDLDKKILYQIATTRDNTITQSTAALRDLVSHMIEKHSPWGMYSNINVPRIDGIPFDELMRLAAAEGKGSTE